MRTCSRLPGFKFLYSTEDKDTVVLRLPSEGVLGLLGKKSEWVIRRDDSSETIGRYGGEITTRSPTYLVENGTVEEACEEIQRWRHPELYGLA